MEELRLNKYLAQCGLCSRRDADKLIQNGKVSVNGKTAETGCKVTLRDIVEVEHERINPIQQKVVLKYYKPVGVTCTERDVHAQYKVSDMVHFPVRVTYAGRLDKNSEGLLLLTNDGDLIDKMMRGSNSHDKEYVVQVDRPVTDEFLKSMSRGVYLKELNVVTRKCRIQRMNSDTFSIVLTQGLNRQIRRMCSALHYHVKALKRIRVMNICLGDLHPGEYRRIENEELSELYRMAGAGSSVHE